MQVMTKSECLGRDLCNPCNFGKHGTKVQVSSPYTRCIWCDKKRMANEIMDIRNWKWMENGFKEMDGETQAKALQWMNSQHREHFERSKVKERVVFTDVFGNNKAINRRIKSNLQVSYFEPY